MSVYAVNSFCRRVVHDPDLRRALAEDPEAALRAAIGYVMDHPRWKLSLQTHKLLGLP